VADRAGTTFFAFAIAARHQFELGNSFWSRGDNLPPNFRELRDMAERTGGRFETITPNVDFTARLAERLDELRHRYVLRYVPTDIRAGWHKLEVEVRGGRYEIRHRRGYWR
jgi:hypothetical protein